MKTTAPPMSAWVYHDIISQRAREIWHARHHPRGKDMEIWLEAEEELVRKGVIPPSPPPLTKTEKSAQLAGHEIDSYKMLQRLDDFGTRPARSATALGVG